MNDWIAVGTYDNELMALLAKAQLEGAGIDVRANVSTTTVLLVEPKNEEQARTLLGAGSPL